jgi:hypothetical protein
MHASNTEANRSNDGSETEATRTRSVFERDPSEYRPSDPDVVLQKREQGVPGGAIAACLERGEISSAGQPGRVRFAVEWLGGRYRLIVERRENPSEKHEIVEICQPELQLWQGGKEGGD